MTPSAAQHFVPEWAADAVWYQIFPERFRNGHPDSSPGLAHIASGDVAGWEIKDWGSDWYRQDAWEASLGNFYRGVFLRRYGGDLIGLREKLSYLQDLGINALYLNPVFTAPSLHKYDGACFHHIDPTFGPDLVGDLARLEAAEETEDPSTWIWTEADKYFLDLAGEIHRRGMRVIIDGVFNHTGRDFFAFKDLLRQGKKSRYVDWYQLTGWNQDGSFDYKGWFNFKGLPEFARTETDLAPKVRQYVFDSTRRWMQPDGPGDLRRGIDGWRLDVAFCVPMGFWRAWRKHVRELNPQAYLTGEIVSHGEEYLQGDVFDGIMNYMWLYAAASFFSPGITAISAPELVERLRDLHRRHPPEVHLAVQNLLDSHDVARIATMLENPDVRKLTWDDYFENTRVRNFPELITRKPGPAAWQALRQLVVFQMTFPGAPMLYYGTEVGMWGANDPDNRQPMLWDDIAYEPEAHSHQGAIPSVPRGPDENLRAFFQKAIRLRKDHPALRRGTLEWLDTGHDRLAGFKREWAGPDGRATIFALFNTSSETLVYGPVPKCRDLWSEGADPESHALEISPRGWRVVALV